MLQGKSPPQSDNPGLLCFGPEPNTATGRSSRPSRGAALVIVMLVMAVLLLAGTTFMTISSTESQIALNERVSIQATLLAEAAIHKTIAQLTADANYAGQPDTMLGNGTFSVTVTNASVQPCPATNVAKDLVATGTVPVRGGQAQVQLRATVDRISYPYRWGAFAAVDYLFLSALSTKQTLTDSFDSSRGSYLSSSSLQGGHVGANGGLYLWYADVKGSARSGGWISSSGDSTASPPPMENVPVEALPDVVPDTTATAGPPLSGSVSLNPGIYIYTTPNLVIPDSTSLTANGGQVIIYLAGTGDVTVGNNVTLGSHPAANLTIVTKSDGPETAKVNFISGSNFKLFGSLYGKNTTFILGDNAEIYGSMIGRRISRGSTAGEYTGSWWMNPPKIHFDQAMYNKPLCLNTSNGKFALLRGSWREMIP